MTEQLPREGNMSGCEDELRKKQMVFYGNDLIPALQERGTSDLTDEYKIAVKIGRVNHNEYKKMKASMML